MIDALFASPSSTSSSSTSAVEPGPEIPSHETVDIDAETGEPLAARFVYVDEHSCIGCTYCSTTARNTFFMEDDHGRARVFNQQGDSEDSVLEAIDTCPVNCIHYVSYEDLRVLEGERSTQVINNAARLRSQQEGTAAVAPTAAINYQSGSMRCNNCPGRGCKECPMFGVGENPVYLERKAAREEKRRRSGEAQREAEEQRRASIILDGLMAEEAEEQEGQEQEVEQEQEQEQDERGDVRAEADRFDKGDAFAEEVLTQEQQQQRAFDVLFGGPPDLDDDDDDEDPLAYTDVG